MLELDPARRDELIELWAHKLVGRGLGTAAVFLLEAHKPLAGLGSQAIVAFQPLLTPLVPINVGELAAFMRSADNVEQLVLRVEQLEADRAAAQEAAQRRTAEIRRRAKRIRRIRRRRQKEP